MPIGLSFPFSLATGSVGYLESVDTTIEAVKVNCRSLLVTNWGERVMHFDFGCNIRQFIFEQKTNSLRGQIAERIKSQFGRWLPYVRISELFISFSTDDVSIPENAVQIDLTVLFGNIPVELSVTIPEG